MAILKNKNICRAEETACTNAHTLSVASITPLSVSAGNKRAETNKMTEMLFISTFLFIFFAFFSTNNVAKAMDTIKLSIPSCTHNIDGCTEWHEWMYHSRTMEYKSDKHSNWPFGPKWFNCNTIVTYRARQCKTNPFMHQYDIISIELDLSYAVWHLQSGGWVYPCREALEILKGSEQEVSEYFNALYNAVYEDIVEADYTMAFKAAEELDKTLGGDYAHYVHNPCKQPDPGNPWNEGLSTVVTSNASCQATCVTWSYDYKRDLIYYLEPENNETVGPFEMAIDRQFLADKYNNGSLESLQVEPIDATGLNDLNNYIQTEINPFIPEQEHKVPFFPSGSAPRMKLTKMPCAEDFCCVYSMTVCQDENGNASLQNKMIIGNVPQECVNSEPISLEICPQSLVTPIPYPCTSNCNVSSQQTSNINEINDVTINMYPNPTNKLLSFEIPTNQILNNLELFDISGNSICKFNTNITTLDLSKFNSGEYYLCFTLNNTKYYRSIIISK